MFTSMLILNIKRFGQSKSLEGAIWVLKHVKVLQTICELRLVDFWIHIFFEMGRHLKSIGSAHILGKSWGKAKLWNVVEFKNVVASCVASLYLFKESIQHFYIY